MSTPSIFNPTTPSIQASSGQISREKPPTTSNARQSESYLREQVDKLFKESKTLKQKVEQLERENLALKRSVYDLTVRLSDKGNGGKPWQPFALDASLDEVSEHTTVASPPLDAAPLTTGNSSPSSRANGKSSPINTTPPPTAATPTIPIGMVAAQSAPRDKGRDNRIFISKHDLKGHNGAVYQAQFSPSGKLIASCSFDKTVKLWEMSSQPREVATFSHSSSVADVCWSSDSLQLLSGSFDQTCKVWGADQSKLLESYEVEGFVQAVMFDPSDANLFYCGTSRKMLYEVDRRRGAPSVSIKNDSMINSLYVYRDGKYVVTGDAAGSVKLWDMRVSKLVSSTVVEGGKPISNLAVSLKRDDQDEPRYMALNSYDNILRVYDRGFAPTRTSLELIHSLKGVKNKNWPIKSSFYCGKDVASLTGKEANDDVELEKETDSILLATGSADALAYVYAIGTSDARISSTQLIFFIVFGYFATEIGRAYGSCLFCWFPSSRANHRFQLC
jgi:COMPASS component SWD3